MERKQTIKEGLNGSGRPIWLVFTEWTSEVTGRKHTEGLRFETLAEAKHWIKWSYPTTTEKMTW